MIISKKIFLQRIKSSNNQINIVLYFSTFVNKLKSYLLVEKVKKTVSVGADFYFRQLPQSSSNYV